MSLADLLGSQVVLPLAEVDDPADGGALARAGHRLAARVVAQRGAIVPADPRL